MRRERTIAIPRCLNKSCDRNAEPGQNGYCSRCGQAVRRRIKNGLYDRKELVARGKLVVSSIDEWLNS